MTLMLTFKAAENGFIDIVKMLVNKKADVNVKNKNGESALIIGKSF